MRHLRILMVAPQPFLRPRGTPFSVLHRVRSMTEVGGHSVDLVTYPFGDDVVIEGLRIVRTPRPPGVKDVRVGPSPEKLALDLPLFVRAWRMARTGGYDLVHSHEEAGALGAAIRNRLGLPHLYDMHSSLPQQFRSFGRYDVAPVVAAFERLERYTLDGSDGVIAISPSLEHRAREVGYRGPLAVVENTLQLPEPPVPDEKMAALRSRLGLEDGATVLAYTGTLERYQGLDLLLEAVKSAVTQLPTLQLVVVGGTADESAMLAADGRARGIERHLVALPAVSPEEVHTYQQLADILVTTRTRGTNPPLKIYQYLRSGRPILATRIAAHTQVLDGASALLVDANPTDLAKGILTLARNPERRRELAAGAEELAGARYSDARYHALLEGIVQTVAASRAGVGTPAGSRMRNTTGPARPPAEENR